MRLSSRSVVLVALIAPVAAACTPAASAARDPLPSWKDGASKKAIVAFVDRVTRQSSPDFVPVPARIATFDNDGTLWAEKPVPFEIFFAFDRVKAQAPQHPAWKSQEPFASVLRGDVAGVAATGAKGLMEIMAATHAGMTTDEFAGIVEEWIASARHPATGRLFTEMVYQPMLELLAYLRGNGFKTFIVSGGGVEFMRPWSERVYGVPPEQVIGSAGKLKLETRDGRLVLVKLPAVDLSDDQEGKPIAIQSRIGRRPIAAFGNSDGDLQMLQWIAGGGGARFALLVHHDDGKREFAYDRADKMQKLDAAWDEAVARRWTVVSMRNDWFSVFAQAK
jgi:phosphoserine phosphatase